MLSGGAARGAYEAGALRFVLNELAARLDRPPRFDIISGTSVGALNGAWLATLGVDGAAADALSRLWRSLRIHDIYHFEGMHLLRAPWRILGRPAQSELSLVDASPLHELVRTRVPWSMLSARIQRGELHAMTMSATEVATGRNVVFVQSATPYRAPKGPESHWRGVRLGPEHCLASSAVPFVFPPVHVDGVAYLDGALRQSTPLKPALRLGADRVLVVNVRQPYGVKLQAMVDQPEPGLNLVFLLGKALSALAYDPVEEDLRHAERLNLIFDWGTSRYGPEFMHELNALLSPGRGSGYRRLKTLVLRPREDLGRVAAACFRERPPAATRATSTLLSMVAEREGDSGELLSYLLFEEHTAATFERLGWEDARARADALAGFFSHVPSPEPT